MSDYMVGYDYKILCTLGIKVPIEVSPESHMIIVGGSGSGKSTALLYFLYKMMKSNHIQLTICDFKASHEFDGITDNFAEFEDCYNEIKGFYSEFLSTPEGGESGGIIKILIIDEIAGLLTHYSMSKETKVMADEIRQIMSSILMLGRSRKCFLWLSMQRFTSSIFPSASGAADNFHACIGLGRLTVEGRKGLFAGEHFEEEDTLLFGCGKGIILIDGEPIKSIIIPKVSKVKLLTLLREQKPRRRAEHAEGAEVGG